MLITCVRACVGLGMLGVCLSMLGVLNVECGHLREYACICACVCSY